MSIESMNRQSYLPLAEKSRVTGEQSGQVLEACHSGHPELLGSPQNPLTESAQFSPLLEPLLKRNAATQASAAGQVMQLHARLVTVHEDGFFTIHGPDEQEFFSVKKAFSCLHQPVVGDRVLVSGNVQDGFYILAIIERAEGQTVTVLELGEQVELKAQNLQMQAQSYQLSVGHYQINSRQVTYRSQKINYYAAKLEENYAQAQRFVAGSDSVHALNFDYKAEHVARIHGQNTFINGEKLLKSDGQLMMVG